VNVLWGVVVTLLSLLAWGGQAIAWFWPAIAVRWNLAEAEDDVEPAFWADGRGEARWDTLTLWTMVVAGVLLIADASSWVYFGLVGGGMYLYFGGRIIFTRVAMQRRSLRIGAPQNVRLGYIFGAVWAAMALITILAAIASLEG
jgi:hypothetical protein